ncbi:hypothetical protein KNU84_gp072 [Bacteriophage DSS3_VP1]|uniref:Uncharacterized protein n=1 Tax=Bacteriophage DSS3_VP1 TaxID=2664196 RepID=A0A7S5KPG8_9CAUD|nr:hypothetical protein KNU84_gp072 [Bacteriophage DSS3_VP1]QGH74632.1 hypothetical protein DSS3VP1_00064 [Bacteriophage DSS3_VP1]
MAIIKNVELHWTKLDPKRPTVINEKDDGEKVTGWEVECRTTEKAQAQAWKKLVGAKSVRAIREDKDDEESPILYWRMKLRKKQFNAAGDEKDAPEVVRGDTLEAMDPNIIGNESIADLRIFQYDYSFKQGGQLVEGVASVLMGVKVKRLVKYVPQAREEWDEDDNEFEVVGGEDAEKEWDNKEDEQPKGKSKSKAKRPSNDIDDDEIPF